MEPVLNQDQAALKTQNRAKSAALKSKPKMTRHVHAINRKHKTQNALNRFAFSRISLAMMTVLGADPALAATYTWVGPEGGVWSNVINWDLGNLPTLNDSISLGNINTFLDTGLNARNINGTGTLTIGNRNLDILGSLILNSTNSTSNLGGLNINHGGLTNNGRLIVSGTTNWSSGGFSGLGGVTRLEGNVFISGEFGKHLNGHTLEFSGNTTQTGLAGVSLSNNARIINSGTWIDQEANGSHFSGSGTFENQGSFIKSNGPNDLLFGSNFGITVNNTGSINVDRGYLSLSGGGTNSGQLNIATGSTLGFKGGIFHLENQNVLNNGTFEVAAGAVNANLGLNLGGTTRITGGTLNLYSDSSFAVLSMSGGTLANNALLNISGNTQSNGGTLAGTGSTILNENLTFRGGLNPTRLLDTQTLTLKGITNNNALTTDTTRSVNYLQIGEGARLVNQGTWLDNTANATTISGNTLTDTGGVFENQGVYTKNQTSTTDIGGYGLTFNNSGTVNINAGKLRMTADGTSSGIFNIAAGSELDFNAGAYLFNTANVNNSGTGVFKVSGATVTATQGLNLGGYTRLTAGTLNLGATSQINNLNLGSFGTLNINAGVLTTSTQNAMDGTVNLNNGAELNYATNHLNNSGTIAGVGTVRVGARLSNSGALVAGGLNSIGQLSIIGNLTQTSAGQMNIDLGRSASDLLAISGTATLGGALNINVTEGLSRGSSYKVITWADRTGNSEFDTISFTQAANYRLGTTYEADGLTVNMKGFNFYWSGPENGGLWSIDQHWSGGNGGRPQAGDGAYLGAANTRINSIQEIAEIVGTGTLTLAGYSDLRLSERANLGGLVLEYQSNFQNNGYAVVNGNSQWLGGLLTGTGTTRFDGDLVMAGSTRGLRGGHTLQLKGTSTYADSNGVMYVSEGARIINNGQWITQSTGVSHGIGNGFGGANGAFDNIGSFTMASPDPNARFSIASITFNNTGTLNVNSGMLDIQSEFNSMTGQINIASDGKLRLSSGIANLKGTINNAGTLRIEGRGVFNPVDSLIVQGGLTILNDSTINNNHSLRITGNFDWKQGTITGTGTTRLEGNTTLSESTHAIVNGHTIEFAGNTTHTGGIIYTGQGSRLINLGTWTEQNTGFNSLSNGYGGVSSTFDNAGMFNKSSNAMFDIGGGVTFNNTGTLNVNAGTLRFSDKVNSTTGQINIASGAVLSFNGGNTNLKGTINNAGTLRVEGRGVLNPVDSLTIQGGQTILHDSTINNTNSLRITGAFEWKQGMLTGAGITRLEGNATLSESTHAVTNGHTIVFAGDTYHTGGIIYTGQGSRLVNLGTWQDQNTGNIDISNGFGDTSSSFDNQGTFIKTGGAMTTFGGDLDLTNTGNIQINAGTLRLLNNFNNHGLMNVAAGAELSGNTPVFGSAGTVTGDGTIRASSNFTNTGTLAAGGLDDAGHLSLIGNFTQGSSGNFLVDLGGVDTGTFDLFSISGNALLGGTLAVNILGGVQFNLGDSFTVMTWNQRLSNSQFANLDFTQANGYQFNAEYNDNNLTLRIVAVPVPEPTSAALLGLGLLGLTGYRLTRKTAAA